MLFPSIFWKDTDNGSMIGAIPSALLASEFECHQLGYADVTDHGRARLTNPSLRTSTDPRYIFHTFDAFANVILRGEDSRLVLNCGFVEKQGKGGVTAWKSEMFNTDSIDSHPVVNRLAAALSEEKAMYFFMQTCNQSDFFGVRELKHWLDGNNF